MPLKASKVEWARISPCQRGLSRAVQVKRLDLQMEKGPTQVKRAGSRATNADPALHKAALEGNGTMQIHGTRKTAIVKWTVGTMRLISRLDCRASNSPAKSWCNAVRGDSLPGTFDIRMPAVK